MSRLADLARAEPALVALAIIAVIGTVVLTVIALSMRAAGLSLRPVAWFAVFIGIIAVPQAAMHLGGALGLVQRPATWVPRVDAADTAGAVRADATPLAADLDALDVEVGPDGPRFRDPAHVFGADVRPAGVRDARAGFGGALDGAVAAQVAFLDYRETVLAARFPSAEAARAARARLLPMLGVAPGGVADAAVVTVRRPVGDVARLAVAGPALFLWAAADDAALARRAASTTAVRTAAGIAAGRATGDASAPLAYVAVRRRAPLVLTNAGAAALMLAMVAAATLWFFKGSAWAAREVPAAGAAALPAAALRARLLAADGPGTPWTATPGDAPDELVVTWRYADARWLDLAGAHGLTRVHRLTLRLDAATRSVRVREQWSAWDASAERGPAASAAGARLAWRTARGITFFEARREATLGIPLGGARATAPGVGASYRFDAQALKAPFREAAIAAGWTWQPLVWDAPAWLRWATE